MSGFKDQLFEQQNDGGATTQSLSCLDAALRYATELDFIVFPAPIGKKKSHKSAKFSNGVNWGATSDPAQICRDFKKWPDANVGIPTGTENGFFVVEADTKEGHNVDGITNLQALIDAHEPLPETRRACSPSGSIHYYFRFPDGVKIKNSASELAPGVDVRGEGGMVVAPPSVKPGVGSYEWLNEADIADAPQWLLDLVIDKGDARVASAEPQPQADPTLVAMALAVIPNNDLGWEQWNNIGLATWRATGGSDAGFAAFDAWSKKSKKYNLDPDSTTTERWTHYPSSPPTEIGAGTLFHMADEASPGWRGPGKHVAGMLPWRERRGKGGFPIASFHNVRLGLVAMGIECRHDLFRDVTIIGFKGDEVTHEVKPLIGELTNAALLRLRLLFSERYCFDPEDKNILDAVKSLAYENCFDPILDMLTEAEGKWDGVNRLDTWVVDYLGCEATELNCAIGRKVLIAAARRARVPGVKFDNITVLESPEGMNKSTAIRVLAGDQFFSDQSILGLRDREVQEQLAGKWMHEIADLSGMRKADVQHVKAFASRQVDRARPAYGRVPEDRPRRSIEWGTTNDDEFSNPRLVTAASGR